LNFQDPFRDLKYLERDRSSDLASCLDSKLNNVALAGIFPTSTMEGSCISGGMFDDRGIPRVKVNIRAFRKKYLILSSK